MSVHVHDNTTSSLLTQLAAFCAGEGAARATRLLATVAVARALGPAELGVAATAIALSEMLKVAANGGLGPALIAVPHHQLAASAKAAARLFHWLCAALAVLQCALGAVLALTLEQPAVLPLCIALALVYPMMAPGLVSCHLIMREGRMARIAEIAATQMVADNLLTVLLVTCWPSVWAVVLPKVLVVPVWLIRTRRAAPYRADPDVDAAPVRPLLRYGLRVVAADLAGAARLHADKLVLGVLLGTEALGIYVFAFNAGLGITLAVTAAFSLIAFPRLCRSNDPRALLRRLLAIGLALVVPLVALQVLASPLYIPLLFGEQWLPAVGAVAVLCLAAPARLMGGLSQQTLRALHQPGREAVWAWSGTLITLIATTTGAVLYGAPGAVGAFVLATWLCDGLLTADVAASPWRRTPVLERRVA
jgi:lipopolysaccharide exporter